MRLGEAIFFATLSIFPAASHAADKCPLQVLAEKLDDSSPTVFAPYRLGPAEVKHRSAEVDARLQKKGATFTRVSNKQRKKNGC